MCNFVIRCDEMLDHCLYFSVNLRKSVFQNEVEQFSIIFRALYEARCVSDVVQGVSEDMGWQAFNR